MVIVHSEDSEQEGALLLILAYSFDSAYSVDLSVLSILDGQGRIAGVLDSLSKRFARNYFDTLPRDLSCNNVYQLVRNDDDLLNRFSGQITFNGIFCFLL